MVRGGPEADRKKKKINYDREAHDLLLSYAVVMMTTMTTMTMTVQSNKRAVTMTTVRPKKGVRR